MSNKMCFIQKYVLVISVVISFDILRRFYRRYNLYSYSIKIPRIWKYVVYNINIIKSYWSNISFVKSSSNYKLNLNQAQLICSKTQIAFDMQFFVDTKRKSKMYHKLSYGCKNELGLLQVTKQRIIVSNIFFQYLLSQVILQLLLDGLPSRTFC